MEIPKINLIFVFNKTTYMYIVIEIFDPHWPSIVTTEEGEPVLFDTKEEAEAEASNCQIGLVVGY